MVRGSSIIAGFRRVSPHDARIVLFGFRQPTQRSLASLSGGWQKTLTSIFGAKDWQNGLWLANCPSRIKLEQLALTPYFSLSRFLNKTASNSSSLVHSSSTSFRNPPSYKAKFNHSPAARRSAVKYRVGGSVSPLSFAEGCILIYRSNIYLHSSNRRIHSRRLFV